MSTTTQETKCQKDEAGSGQAILDIRDISKTFPGVKALDHVSLQLYEGQILGLVGENGAGKSTLMKILAGVYIPDSGQIIFRGNILSLRNSLEAARAGIGMVHQELSLVPNLSVAENIYLGREERFLRWSVFNWKKMWREAETRLEQLGYRIDPRAQISSLSFLERQMVEIARVISLEDELHYKPIIILDEATTALSGEEIDRLFEIMRHLSDRKYSTIFISHRLEEVLEIAEKIYVLKDGRNVGALESRDTRPARLQKLMVGRELHTEFYQESKQTVYGDEVLLKVRDLTKAGAFYDVSFDLHRGEVLGLAGAQGSGIRELARTLFGIMNPDQGRISIRGEDVSLRTPIDAIKRKVGYLPQERGEEGLILYFSLPPNITLPSLDRMARAGFLSFSHENSVCDSWIEELNIKTPMRHTVCANLSGGNQQKVVLSKWLEANVDILIMDHPTRGIDVGAKEEVYTLIRQLTDRGISIILIADSLEELIGLSNTILVMKDSRIQKKMDAPAGEKPTPQDIISYMV